MIVIENLEQAVDENKTLPLEDAGELEQYLAKSLQPFLLQNFGIVCTVSVKKK